MTSSRRDIITTKFCQNHYQKNQDYDNIAIRYITVLIYQTVAFFATIFVIN